MKRWQWWLIGLALITGILALLLVFWPKLIESAQRCCLRCGPREEPVPELDESPAEAA